MFIKIIIWKFAASLLPLKISAFFFTLTISHGDRMTLSLLTLLLLPLASANELYAHEWRPDAAARAVAAAATHNLTDGRHGGAVALPAPDPPLGYQPNFVFILTDDQVRRCSLLVVARVTVLGGAFSLSLSSFPFYSSVFPPTSPPFL